MIYMIIYEIIYEIIPKCGKNSNHEILYVLDTPVYIDRIQYFESLDM